MKSLFLVLALCFFAFQNAHALTCLDSAEFKGEITHVVDDGFGCWAHLDFDYYVPSFYCPLDRDQVEKFGIYTEGRECPFRLGQILSGTAVMNDEGRPTYSND